MVGESSLGNSNPGAGPLSNIGTPSSSQQTATQGSTQPPPPATPPAPASTSNDPNLLLSVFRRALEARLQRKGVVWSEAQFNAELALNVQDGLGAAPQLASTTAAASSIASTQSATACIAGAAVQQAPELVVIHDERSFDGVVSSGEIIHSSVIRHMQEFGYVPLSLFLASELKAKRLGLSHYDTVTIPDPVTHKKKTELKLD